MVGKSRHYLFLVSVVCVIFTMVGPAAGVAATDEPSRDGKVGLTASLQGSQRDIELPYWISESTVITPALMVLNISDVGTDLGFGMTLRFNTRQGELVPYFGLRFGILMFSPESGDSTTDFIVGPTFGGEYFLSEHFSLTVEGQLNAAISDESSGRFNNPDGTVITTATAAKATVYF